LSDGYGPAGPPAAQIDFRTAGCAAVHPSPATTGSAGPAGPSRIDELVNRFLSQAQLRFPDVYTGLEILADRSGIRVYRLPSALFDGWVVGEFANNCVEVARARHSVAGTAQLRARIVADLDYWDARHIFIAIASVQPDGSIGLGLNAYPHGLSRAGRDIVRHYHSDIPIDVYKTNVQSRPG
jgi:hypothetical protein